MPAAVEPSVTNTVLKSPATGTVKGGRWNLHSMSKKTKTRLKLLFSLVMFASLFVFGKVDLSRVWEATTKANIWFLAASFALYQSCVFFTAWRWKVFASALGFERPLSQLTQYCFVGLFFNLFLPSTVGGDFSRGYYLSKGGGKYTHAFYSVLADRAVGIAVLFLFASLGILLGPGGATLPWQMKLPIFAGTVAIFTLIPLAPKLTRLILGSDNWLTKRFNNSAIQSYWQDRKIIMATMTLSIIMQVVVVICHIGVGLSLGIDVPVWYYFVFYPSVAVLGFVTPSVNGIGVREWAYTYFLTLMGVDKAIALTYAIMWLGMNTLTSLLGGLVYVGGHLQIPKDEAEKIQNEAV